MAVIDDAPNRCLKCGAPIEAGRPCLQCLLRLGLADDALVTATTWPRERFPARGAAPRVTDRIDSYHLLRILGEGGMGIVYLAEQEQPIQRQVALKVIKPGIASPAAVARFESERQALAVMEHPNIAHVYDAGTTDAGQPYFVMEYVPGPSITEYCDQHNLSNRNRLKLFRQVCLAIHHAHQKGVIHRDIKPSNVLVTERDGEPVPKVIDFGIAKAIEQHQASQSLFTQKGMLVGTPEYMSPEQAALDTHDIDASSDVYSLGVMLYELLVGALPFDPKELRKKGLLEILRIIREEDPVSLTNRFRMLPGADEIALRRDSNPGTLRRQLSGDLDWITMRAMEKDRRLRYSSAAEFAGDVERYLNNEPVIASPPSRLYRVRKFVSKNRWPVTAAAAILMALCLGLVASTILYFRAEGQRIEAQRERAEAERQRVEAERQRSEAERQQTAAQRERAEALRQGQVAELQRNLTGQALVQTEQSRRDAEFQRSEAEQKGQLADERAVEALRQRQAAVEQKRLADQALAQEEQERLKADQANAAEARARLLAQRQSYTARLSAADSLLRSNEVAEAKRQLLSCPANLRGWEWRFLMWKADSSITTVRAQGVRALEGSSPRVLTPSSDATRILWASSDALYSWAASSYAPAGDYHGFEHILAFSRDGSLLVSASAKPAHDESGAELLPWLASDDRRIWEAPPASSPAGQLRHEIHLTFSKPAHAATAKLLVHAGTGEWGLRMLNTLFELYGQDLAGRLASLDSNPIDAAALKLWSATEDLYALKVWVEEPSGWQVRGMIPGGGMGARVVELDVSHVKGDEVHIRLQPPAGFWAINSAAIDFSPEQNLTVNRIAPQSARTSAGKDVSSELQATDGSYYTAVKGDSVSVGFDTPPEQPGMSRTVFLHSNGYYRPDVRSQGPADNVTLSKIFTTRDGLARFAAERYAAWRLAPLAAQ